jgi:mono/diheme cytochrome c family protein
MVRWRVLRIGLLLVVSLTACSPSEKLSNAEIQGQWLYDGHCAECHENPHPELRKQPPNLHRLFLSEALPSGAPATDEQVSKTVIEGRGTMPAFDQRLRKQDVKELVAYLHKLK